MFMSNRKTSLDEILKILRKKGNKSIEIAREAILKEKIQNGKAREAIQYYLNNFLDPTPAALLTLSCEIVDPYAKKTFFMGAAITLLFGAIDIHDDVIDKSVKKNGKLTVFGKFGEETAILVGDAFLFEGFSLLNKAVRHIECKKAYSLMETLVKAFLEMGDGHALEMNLKGKLDVSPEEYMHITNKKAASWEAVTKIGALIGNGKKHEIEALARYGRIWGILSTIRNDFVDLFEATELRNRMLNEILPLPILCAFKDVKMKEKIIKLLSKKITKKDTEAIIDLVFGTEQVRKLIITLRKFMTKGKFQLATFKKSQSKVTLEAFISAMLEDLE
jgi:geranylgeranyl pyrophosphate synthase